MHTVSPLYKRISMGKKARILIFISILLLSCAPEAPAQEDEIIEIATDAPVIEVPKTQEPVITEEPVATELPSEIPLACVTLLTPVNGAEIPPVGKVTFSWTPMDEAGKYVLNIILPSGDVVPFETDQTFRDRYMEAFVTGGEYQWWVIAQDVDGSQICVSEVSAFDKLAYNKKPNDGGGNDGSGGNDSGGLGEGPPDFNE